MRFLIVFFVFLFIPAFSFCQVLSNETIDSAVIKVNTLYPINSDSSLAELKVEANRLKQSDQEILMIIAMNTFNILGDSIESLRLKAVIIKKFPKGIMARDLEFENLMKDIAPSLSNDDFYTASNEFINKYPRTNFVNMVVGSYDYGFGETEFYNKYALETAVEFVKRKDFQKALEAIYQTPDKTAIPSNYSKIGELLLIADHYQEALPLIDKAYQVAIWNKSDASIYLHAQKADYDYTAGLYAQALNRNNDFDKALEVLLQLHKSLNNNSSNSKLLASLLDKKGKSQEAFTLLEEYMLQNEVRDDSSQVYIELARIFPKLNRGEFSEYNKSLVGRIKEKVSNRLKKSMLNKPAADFTLKDQTGKDVSLFDYKGKVVVLDFWATWCGPCLRSFPGMQATIEKYKEDNEVVFLFINTQETAKNYKELVAELIKSNQYDFHVLYDDNKERHKTVYAAYLDTGLPKKVIIDPAGRVRFSATGSSSDVVFTVEEISNMIELARAPAK